MPRPRAAACAAFLLLLALVAGFWGALVPARLHPHPPAGPSLVAWDLYSYFLPKLRFGTEELLAGRLPVWNRFEYAGIPFLATAQPGAAYLPKLLVFGALDETPALWLFLALHHLLAAGGMLVLLRGGGIGLLGALAGALYAAFAAPFLLSMYHPSRLAALAWTPWLFAAAEAIGRGGGGRVVAGLALATAMQLTAGYPEITLDCALLLGLHALVRLVTRTWTVAAPRALARLAAGVALGFLAAGVQTFPLAALVLQAERATLAEAAIELFRQPGMTLALTATAVWSFPALAGTALAALGRRTAAAPAAGLAACVVLIAVAWPWLRALPGYAMARHPLVWSWVAPFFVAWLVALGVERLAAGRAGGAVRALVAAFGAGLALVAVAALVLGEAAPLGVGLGWTPYVVRDAALPPGGASGAALPAAAAGGVALAVATLAGRPGAVPVAVALLVASQIAAFPFGSPLPPLVPPPAPARVSALLGRVPGPEDGRAFSIQDVAGGWQLRERVENVLGAEHSILPPRFARVLDRLGVNLVLGRADWDAVARAPGFLDALDVGFVVAPLRMRDAFAAAGLDRVGGTAAHLALYANREPGARARVVHAATVLDPEAALDRLLAPDFDPRREVLLEAPPDGAYPARATRPPSPAVVRRDGPTRVEVTTAAPEAGLLVLADACFPGWTATLDDRPARVHCANVLVRAVEVPAGTHHVRFTYHAPGLGAGIVASLLALGCCALLLVRRDASAP